MEEEDWKDGRMEGRRRKETTMNYKFLMSILATILLIISVFFVSCGFQDDNNQPEIESLTDHTLYVGDKTTVEVYITDADVDDIHTISASSDNPTVVTVSFGENHLTITGNAAGMATITVSATDDSEQDNATSLPVTFQVTVNEQPINKGFCVVGMILQPGEGCVYFTDQGVGFFYVNDDSEGCRRLSYTSEIFGLPVDVTLNLECEDKNITGGEALIHGEWQPYGFHASKNSNGSWTIDKVR